MLPNWLKVRLRVIETALAMPKSRTLTCLSRGSDADIAGLDVAVDDAAMRALLDHGLEGVSFDEDIEDVLERDIHSALGIHGAVGEKVGEILALDVFHRDVEVAIAIAHVEDLGYAATFVRAWRAGPVRRLRGARRRRRRCCHGRLRRRSA